MDDPQLGNGVDPMAALENGQNEEQDPMAALEGKGEGGEEEARPKVADEFEQQAEREVAAENALGGTAEEGKMKLVHQVRHQVSNSIRDAPQLAIGYGD